MNTNTSRRRRYARRAGALTFAALLLGAAACGTETAADSGQPAAPATSPHATPQAEPHAPTSADAAERRARAEQLEQYRRHLQGAAQ
jgi:hypothetical protein